jgi:DTW domain-containing protein YfiP
MVFFVTTQSDWRKNKMSKSEKGNTPNDSSKNTSTTTSTTKRHRHEILIADSIGKTVEEYRAMKKTYQDDSDHLHQRLRNLDVAGPIKHKLHCQHRLKYGRQPGVCPNCWSYFPVCICSENIQQHQQPLPLEDCMFQIRIWTHHKEWGSPSNTGKVLSMAFPPPSCLMLMKGLDEHDAQLYESMIISSSSSLPKTNPVDRIIPVVLWPKNCDDHHNKMNNNGKSKQRQRKSYTVSEFRDKFLMSDNATTTSTTNHSPRKQQRIILVLIALEGTWNHARRMLGKIPICVPTLHLSMEEIFAWRNSPTEKDASDIVSSSSSSSPPTVPPPPSSVLHPLRKQKRSASSSNNDPSHKYSFHKVCTAEAIISALLALSLISLEQARMVLGLVERKVQLTASYQGKPCRNRTNI